MKSSYRLPAAIAVFLIFLGLASANSREQLLLLETIPLRSSEFAGEDIEALVLAVTDLVNAYRSEGEKLDLRLFAITIAPCTDQTLVCIWFRRRTLNGVYTKGGGVHYVVDREAKRIVSRESSM